jgi:hypothetical protein
VSDAAPIRTQTELLAALRAARILVAEALRACTRRGGVVSADAVMQLNLAEVNRKLDHLVDQVAENVSNARAFDLGEEPTAESRMLAPRWVAPPGPHVEPSRRARTPSMAHAAAPPRNAVATSDELGWLRRFSSMTEPFELLDVTSRSAARHLVDRDLLEPAAQGVATWSLRFTPTGRAALRADESRRLGVEDAGEADVLGDVEDATE